MVPIQVESNQRFVSQLKEKAPETVGLFRDKEAQLRELRSQLNRKDVQLLSYAHKVEALKRNNKQLTAGESFLPRFFNLLLLLLIPVETK